MGILAIQLKLQVVPVRTQEGRRPAQFIVLNFRKARKQLGLDGLSIIARLNGLSRRPVDDG